MQALSLITDPQCELGHTFDGAPFLDLSAFKKLIKLTWRGIQTAVEFLTLQEFFEERYSSLEELTLEVFSRINKKIFAEDDGSPLYGEDPFVSFVIPYDLDEPQGRFTYLRSDRSCAEISFEENVLPHASDGAPKRFSSLKSLTLIGFTWYQEEIDIWIHALNFAHLKSLTLHFCHDTSHLLEALPRLKAKLQLKKLELVEIYMDFTNDLIQACDALESLYIMHGLGSLPQNFWSTVDTHATTLRRLVVHTRKEGHDTSGLPLQMLNCRWDLSTYADCVGLSHHPKSLVSSHETSLETNKY